MSQMKLQTIMEDFSKYTEITRYISGKAMEKQQHEILQNGLVITSAYYGFKDHIQLISKNLLTPNPKSLMDVGEYMKCQVIDVSQILRYYIDGSELTIGPFTKDWEGIFNPCLDSTADTALLIKYCHHSASSMDTSTILLFMTSKPSYISLEICYNP